MSEGRYIRDSSNRIRNPYKILHILFYFAREAGYIVSPYNPVRIYRIYNAS